jgi:hypothetical protein
VWCAARRAEWVVRYWCSRGERSGCWEFFVVVEEVVVVVVDWRWSV